MFTWDPLKRQINLQQHGIDFLHLSEAFDNPMLSQEDDRESYGECRMQSLAFYNSKVVFIVWTERDEQIRLISCRYATKHETKRYLENT